MKIHSRKHFILGLLCGLMMIFEYKHFDGAKSLIWIGFFLYLMVSCMIAAFSKDAYEQEQVRTERAARVRKRLLGPFGAFAELIALGLCVLGVILYGVLWSSEWGGVLLFICFGAAIVFALWFNMRFREGMRQEEEADEENNEEAKS